MSFVVRLLILSISVSSALAGCAPNVNFAPCQCNQLDDGQTELQCIEAFDNQQALNEYFQYLSGNITGDEDRMLTRLLTSKNKFTAFNDDTFASIQFSELQIDEANLTTVEADCFKEMSSLLRSVSIKSNRLSGSIFVALEPASNLETLSLSLGLRSFRTFGSELVGQHLANLTTISISNIATSIESKAFGHLPALSEISIQNELITIKDEAFDFRGYQQPKQIKLGLSNNKLDEISLFDDFILLDSSVVVQLNLQSNRFKEIPVSLRSILVANKNNQVLMSNNPIDCSNCANSWVMDNVTTQEQLEASCHQGGVSVFKYDWSGQCNRNGAHPCLGSFTLVAMLFFLLRTCL